MLAHPRRPHDGPLPLSHRRDRYLLGPLADAPRRNDRRRDVPPPPAIAPASSANGISAIPTPCEPWTRVSKSRWCSTGAGWPNPATRPPGRRARRLFQRHPPPQRARVGEDQGLRQRRDHRGGHAVHREAARSPFLRLPSLQLPPRPAPGAELLIAATTISEE